MSGASSQQPPGLDRILGIEISLTALLALFAEFTKMALAPALASSLVQLSLIKFDKRKQALISHLVH